MVQPGISEGLLAARHVQGLTVLLHVPGTKIKLMAVFEAYFDESGIHRAKFPRRDDARVFTLAGYLAPSYEWESFAFTWKMLLREQGIKVFHAKDCNARVGEFKKFKDKPDEHKEFISQLFSVISQRSQLIPFYVGVVWDDYLTALKPVIQPPDEKRPYYTAMKVVMSEMAWWMNNNSTDYTEKIGCVFDRQEHFSGYALNLFDKIVDTQTWTSARFDTLCFGSKKRFLPLQAADALAFESNLEFARRRFSPADKPREAFAALTKHLDRDTELSGALWDKQYIERFIELQRKHQNPIEVKFGQSVRFW